MNNKVDMRQYGILSTEEIKKKIEEALNQEQEFQKKQTEKPYQILLSYSHYQEIKNNPADPLHQYL